MNLLGLFDSITGGAAQVWIEYPRHILKPGEQVHIKITVLPRAHLRSNGVFADLMSSERGYLNRATECANCSRVGSSSNMNINNRMYYQSVPLAGPLQFFINQVRVFEGYLTIPPNAQPTYLGTIRHEWQIRGRVDAFGNDPDSGFQNIVVR